MFCEHGYEVGYTKT